MRFKLSDRKVTFEYGALNAPVLTPIDARAPIAARIVVRMNQMGTTSQTGGFLSKKSIPKPQKSIWKSRREKKRGERALSRLTPAPRRFN